MNNHTHAYPKYAKIIHLGIAVLGVTAYLTAELAEDGNSSLGYLLHAYLGLSLAAFMLLRICVGLSSSASLSFKGWSPFSRLQLKLVLEDFRSLLTLKVPERDRHQGLAGMTQAFGLILFTWMAATGTALFFLEHESNPFEFVEELHEVGESLIPFYLLLHVGAVVLHSLIGQPIWKKMFASR